MPSFRKAIYLRNCPDMFRSNNQAVEIYSSLEFPRNYKRVQVFGVSLHGSQSSIAVLGQIFYMSNEGQFFIKRYSQIKGKEELGTRTLLSPISSENVTTFRLATFKTVCVGQSIIS